MATASPSASTSPPRIKVKKEICTENDAIKELAETAMNDILGWYGYDSVDRLELAATSLASASTSAANDEDGTAGGCRPKPDHDNALATAVSSGSPSTSSGSSANLRKSKPNTQAASSKHHHHLQQQPVGGHFLPRHQDDPAHPVPSTSTSGSERRGRETPSNTGRSGHSGSPPGTSARNGVVLHHQAHPHHPAGGESSTSEKDSSRESSKSPMLMKALDKQEQQTCQWCRKAIPSHQAGILGTTEGMIFCTEACFSQSRRASFKRAKTCDWCRHVRHAVSYVDFQDGASQLQFCSDKCLNQYKMQIFCNETQAHLELNPHLKEKSTSAGSLITPELWMKNCKSCSMSPVSDRSESVSPVPSIAVRSSPEPSPIALHSPTPAKKPLISVAPPSKLLSKTLQQSPLSRPSSKGSRKRRAGHRPPGGSHGSVASKRSSSAHHAEYSAGSINNNNATIPNNNLAGSPSTAGPASSAQSKPNPVLSSSVQDLRVLQKKHNSIGSLGPNGGPSMAGFDGRDPSMGGSLGPPPPPPPPLNIPPQFLPPPLNLLRAPFFPMNPGQMRFGGGMGSVQNTQPPPPMGPPPSPLSGVPGLGGPGSRPPMPNLLGLGATPPVTILVPYPIIVPLPLPIPVPIPVIDFLKAALPKEENVPADEKPREGKVSPEADTASTVTPMAIDSDETNGVPSVPAPEEDMDVPLDFTVGGSGKVWSETEHPVPSAKGDELPTYSLSTIVCNDPEPGVSIEEGQSAPGLRQESAKQLLPRFKITRIEPGKPHDADEVHPLDEEDIERERKEMVERSRPLRKRKRLVVMQHLQSEQMQEATCAEGSTEDQEFSVDVANK